MKQSDPEYGLEYCCSTAACQRNHNGVCTVEGNCDYEPEDDEDQEIDHEYTKEIVCPACGYEYQDSWECFLSGTYSETEEECPECGAKFRVAQEIEVTYSTVLIEEKK